MTEPKEYIDEKKRLEDLADLQIVDTDPEEDFDNLTALAVTLCNTPIALVTLLTEDRQFFKSHFGLDIRETPKSVSFCGHAIHTPNDIFIIEDARKDKRFFDNPSVTKSPKVIFYAGVPVLSRNGYPMGTLCVID